jgi:hypothetical protein
MLSVATARALKEAGLAWQPAQLDFFAIPDRGLDDRVFVLAEMPANLAQVQGQSLVTFEGAVEWALDYVATAEVLWLPTEEQLRAILSARLAAEPGSSLALTAAPGRCWCEISFRGQGLVFEAADGAEAYAAALLHILRSLGEG